MGSPNNLCKSKSLPLKHQFAALKWPTIPETNSLLGRPMFRGELLVSGRVSLHILWRIFHFKGLPPCQAAMSSKRRAVSVLDRPAMALVIISYHEFLNDPYQSLSILTNPYQSGVETIWESSMIVPACSLSSTKYGRRTHPIRREKKHLLASSWFIDPWTSLTSWEKTACGIYLSLAPVEHIVRIDRMDSS